MLVKPNIGGSGPGIDGLGLLQEHVPAESEAIVRIEIVDGRFLYAVRLLLARGTFNLCPLTARDGEPVFYDINALSNVVADAPTVIGFNPYADLASLIAARAGLTTAAKVSAA